MKDDQNKYLGYLKYYGEKVDGGFLDANKAANALIGFDEIIRYFIYQEKSSLQKIDFEIPVKIEEGSWVAYIPENIQDWLYTSGGLAITTYVATAAKKMADHDFREIGFNTIFKKVFKSICWFISIARHLRTTKKENFERLKFRNKNTEVGILNESGELIYVPVETLELYKKCPDSLFSKVVQIIEEGREMEIGLLDSDRTKAVIRFKDKGIFYREEDDGEITLPELIHGQNVELKGHITRGNEKTNTIGFLYFEHVLTCKPKTGSIVPHKLNLFTNCLIKGVVDRHDKLGNFKEKKPVIVFTELIPIELDNQQQVLF